MGLVTSVDNFLTTEISKATGWLQSYASQEVWRINIIDNLFLIIEFLSYFFSYESVISFLFLIDVFIENPIETHSSGGQTTLPSPTSGECVLYYWNLCVCRHTWVEAQNSMYQSSIDFCSCGSWTCVINHIGKKMLVIKC